MEIGLRKLGTFQIKERRAFNERGVEESNKNLVAVIIQTGGGNNTKGSRSRGKKNLS